MRDRSSNDRVEMGQERPHDPTAVDLVPETPQELHSMDFTRDTSSVDCVVWIRLQSRSERLLD